MRLWGIRNDFAALHLQNLLVVEPPHFQCVFQTFAPHAQIKNRHLGRFFICGRSDWVRTSDLYVPNVALYQAELHSENLKHRRL